MPAWLLKLIATCATGLAALGSAAYVSSHVKDAQAPLHPPVAESLRGPVAMLGPGAAADPGRRAPTDGHLNLRPSVQTADSQPPLTFTSVS